MKGYFNPIPMNSDLGITINNTGITLTAIATKVKSIYGPILIMIGGARGVMAIVVGKGHGDTSSNPGRDW